MPTIGNLRLGEEHQIRHDTRKNARTTCARRSDVSCDSLSFANHWRQLVNSVKVHFY